MHPGSLLPSPWQADSPVLYAGPGWSRSHLSPWVFFSTRNVKPKSPQGCDHIAIMAGRGNVCAHVQTTDQYPASPLQWKGNVHVVRLNVHGRVNRNQTWHTHP